MTDTKDAWRTLAEKELRGRPVDDLTWNTLEGIEVQPLYTAEDVAGAHAADMAIQDQYGVVYRSYWVDEKAGKVFCLVEAPSPEAAATVHREAHGLVAEEIFEVIQG